MLSKLPTEERPSAPRPGMEPVLVGAALLLLTAAVFARTFQIYWAGWGEEQNQQGAAVPFLLAFLVWLRWPAVRRVPTAPDRKTGMAVLVPTLLLQIVGVWLGLERSVGLLFPLTLWGLCLFFWGRARTRALAFPLLFSLFLAPVPGGLLDMASAPMQTLSARWAVLAAGLCGVNARAEGVNLVLPDKHISYQVAVACSGLHSLAAMCLLAALLAGLSRLPLWGKLTLFALAVPLAVAGNVVRIALVLLVANAKGQDAGLAFHDGWPGKLVPFMLAFAVLLGLSRLLEAKSAERRRV